MSFGRSADQRREAAKVHLKDVHRCPRCEREIRGNAYYRHKVACIRDTPLLSLFLRLLGVYKSASDATAIEVDR